jgi:methylase of polypeptide subunit release factors
MAASTVINQPAAESITVNAARYLSLNEPPRRLKPQLDLKLASRAYLPRVDDLASDWVAHVAAPAFRLYRQRLGGDPIESFCSIGTGSGLDVLTAIELLGARQVGLTDVHAEVVAAAAGNVARNHLPAQPVTIESGHGDLLEPLRKFNRRYALIYENLPNVPVADAAEINVDRKSSTYVPPRREVLPPLVKRQMLDLHYLALAQAPDFLQPGGSVLSILGARVPLEVYLELGRLTGLEPSFLTFSWKHQADPEEIIREHARKQAEGFGPFNFYRAEILQNIFARVPVAESGARALDLERELRPERLDASAALAALKTGQRIAHTVVVLQSRFGSAAKKANP